MFSYQNSNHDIVLRTEPDIVQENSNVFIGQVIKYEGMRPYLGGNGTAIPYSYYKVKPLYNLKGTTNKYEHVIFYGGKILGVNIRSEDQPSLPKIGNVYLFISSPIKNSHEYRAKKGYFFIGHYNLKTLQGYDINKTPFEQNQDIDNLLDGIKYYIDNPTSNYLNSFFKEHNLYTNIYDLEQFNYINNNLQIRIYYIDEKYYLYYNNQNSTPMTFHYIDGNGEEKIFTMITKGEAIQLLNLDEKVLMNLRLIIKTLVL